jgi:hypothetical protein
MGGCESATKALFLTHGVRLDFREGHGHVDI